VVIAVSSQHFEDWIRFAGMSVKLHCDRARAPGMVERRVRQRRPPRQAGSGNRLRNRQVSQFPAGAMFAVAVPHAHENDGLWRTSL
jgi:hypothetical protein